MKQSLYQKHRPATFDDIAGQPQVVSVLEKAVENGEPAHAYLLTGPRGIGKTSAARIFATRLDCAPIDVFEIDAASHTSVEHIRELTASVYTQPVESSYKVYILDEVHMLSKAAFNAFLKTLEEPPAYAIFILVTTESDKVPDTIVSRCIPLSFRQPSLALLQEGALALAGKEGYVLEEQSAALIALMADGSFRDMVTVIQKILFTVDGKNVSHDTVETILGAPKHRLVNDYVRALTKQDVQGGIHAVAAAAKDSVDMTLFARLCIRKIRAALLVQSGITDVLDEYTDEDRVCIQEVADQGAVSCQLLKSLIAASLAIPGSPVKTLPLEYLLIDAAVISTTAS
ncbi:MAG: DNA polymerase III subunit gamma/tau [Candidatus Kaiserbacteria bacterium]|nr:DNA polymerase III subunit gamma/tau [Candidatus Kaiserbacteria bacterium]